MTSVPALGNRSPDFALDIEDDDAEQRNAARRTSRCWGAVFMGIGVAVATASAGIPSILPLAESSTVVKEIAGTIFIFGFILGAVISTCGFSKFMFGEFCCSCRSDPQLANGDVGMTA